MEREYGDQDQRITVTTVSYSIPTMENEAAEEDTEDLYAAQHDREEEDHDRLAPPPQPQKQSHPRTGKRSSHGGKARGRDRQVFRSVSKKGKQAGGRVSKKR